jgi:aminoglycoside phosphotransferase (APT) family kinase protein
MEGGMLADDAPAGLSFLEERRSQFYPKADVVIDDQDLRDLAQLPAQISVDDARRALLSRNIAAVSIEPMSSTGTFHELFTVSEPSHPTRVLKVNRVPALFADRPLLAELSISSALSARGIPHAQIRVADCRRDAVSFDFQVIDFVAGESFRAFDGDEAATIAVLPLLATYLRQCHAIEGDGFGLLANAENDGELSGSQESWSDYLSVELDRHVRLTTAAGLVSAAEAADIAAVFATVASVAPLSRGRLLHGDCGPHNSIRTLAGQVLLIDWEDAVLGDPLFDVAMWATFNPPRRWEVFFDAYFGRSWRPDFLFWAYFLRISLAKTVVRLRFDYHDVSGREPASRRIQQALAALVALGS